MNKFTWINFLLMIITFVIIRYLSPNIWIYILVSGLIACISVISLIEGMKFEEKVDNFLQNKDP